MDFITYEQTEEILCRIDDEWDESEASYRRIIVTTEQWKNLLWLAENTTYCRKGISTMAYSGYLYGSHPRAHSYHRRIQQTLLETGLDFYLIDWEEDLIQYALDVVGMDIHSFHYRSFDKFLKRLPFLLSRGFDVDIQNEEGYTFLHQMIRCSSPNYMIHSLLDQFLPYQPELFLPNFRGETPLDLAGRLRSEIYERLMAQI